MEGTDELVNGFKDLTIKITSGSSRYSTVSTDDLYRADFDLETEEEDELEFKQGDILNILKKENDGWAFATTTKVPYEVGWVPLNHLRPYQAPSKRAVKWGEASYHYPHVFSPGRSGLTPRQPVEKELSEKERKAEEYQRHHLLGFTTRELYEAGAVEMEGLAEGDLKEVCELYSREHWLDYNERYQRSSWKTLDKNGVLWDPRSNEKLWKAVKPALSLASKFIVHGNYWPWWQALFDGPRKTIDPFKSRNFNIYEHGDLESFHIHPANNSTKKTPWTEVFSKMAKNFRLIIDCSPESEEFKDTDTSQMASAGISYAHRSYERRNEYRETGQGNGPRPGDREPYVLITLNRLVIAPLLRKDISVSERLIAQFSLAVVILHETAHALEMWRKLQNGITQWNEPYFENEPCCELGYSMENAIFGGTIHIVPQWQRIPEQKDLKPDEISGIVMCLLTDPFPNYQSLSNHFYEHSGPDLLPPLTNTPRPTTIRYPIPLTYISEIQTEAFWNLITSPSSTALIKFFPKILGIRETLDLDENKVIERETLRGSSVEDVRELREQLGEREVIEMDSSPWDRYRMVRAGRWGTWEGLFEVLEKDKEEEEEYYDYVMEEKVKQGVLENDEEGTEESEEDEFVGGL